MSLRPARVLHVLGSLNRGGAETWASQVLARVDRSRVEMDFMVHRPGGVLEEVVRRSGARVHTLDVRGAPLLYMRRLERLLVQTGPYDVVHSHLQLFSGVVLRCAARVGVPGRVAHSRNTSDGHSQSLYRAAYNRLMRRWLTRYGTHFFAVSQLAAEGAFGPDLARGPRCALMTGIDFTPFLEPVDRDQVRRSLGLEPDQRAVGHLGSFRRQKNHAHLLRVARLAIQRNPGTVFVLIGDGALRAELAATVHAEGLDGSFRFLGERSDAPRILAALDAFLFPSFHEGLPRALLEAQAAGLPCVASTAVTSEAAGDNGLVSFVDLEAALDSWVLALEKALARGASREQGREAVDGFTRRGLTPEANARTLMDLYEGIARGRQP